MKSKNTIQWAQSSRKTNGKTGAQSSKEKKSHLLKKPIGGKIGNSKRR